jgi:peptidyl-prolyl cis-trans isomerase B (cyclophilin B)
MQRTRSIAGSVLLFLLATLLSVGCDQSSTSAPSAPASESAADTQGAGTTPGVGAIAALDDFIAAQHIDQSNPQWKTRLPKPPKVAFDDKTYYWDLETNVGKITIRLMPDVAPMHTSSTIYLTRLGFFDGLVFHRVIPRFMAQGGDPLGNGRGGPGYRYEGEFDASVRHDRPGLLSMANAGPGTDGSQFFITFVPTPHLDGKHTIFGEVTDGMDTVETLEKWRTKGSSHMGDRLEISKAEIRTE